MLKPQESRLRSDIIIKQLNEEFERYWKVQGNYTDCEKWQAYSIFAHGFHKGRELNEQQSNQH